MPPTPNSVLIKPVKTRNAALFAGAVGRLFYAAIALSVLWLTIDWALQ